MAKFHSGEIPAVASVAVVPVGLTRFRPVEDELIPVTTAKAEEVIDQVQEIQAKVRYTSGTNCIWLADEWFLIGRRELPPASEYEDYPQIGNGVGSIRHFISQFEAYVKEFLELNICLSTQRKLTWVVGNAVEKAFVAIANQLNQIEGLEVNMIPLSSSYWGQDITVTGLLTGQDLLEGLQGRDLGEGILLPSVMLKQGDNLFLDDMTLEDLSVQLETNIWPVAGVEELVLTAVGDRAGFQKEVAN